MAHDYGDHKPHLVYQSAIAVSVLPVRPSPEPWLERELDSGGDTAVHCN